MSMQPAKSYLFNELILWVESSLHLNIGVEDVIIKSGYSKRHIQYIFKEMCGRGVSSYIKDRRLSRAAGLLRLTNKSVIDICNIYFFKSPQSFSRSFKNKFGISPSKYRSNQDWLLNNYTGRYTRQNKVKSTIVFIDDEYLLLVDNKKFYLNMDFIYNSNDKPHGHKPDGLVSYLKCNIKSKVINKLCKVLYVVKPNNNNYDTIEVDVSVFKRIHTSNSIGATNILGGYFCMFSFNGTWDDYYHFSDSVYTTELPRLGLNKRNSYDFEIYKSDCHHNENFISVDFYIPISFA